jgi:hypothetical protein
MIHRIFVAALAAALAAGCASASPGSAAREAPEAPSSEMSSGDRARLAEAFRLAASLGDRVWPGWSGAPFAVLLVTPDREYLLRHPRPSADFVRGGYDSLLGSDVFVRARVFSPTLLATFPAVGGVPTIVIGPASLTGKASTAWVLTVLHEHFHQLQTSRPDYFSRVEALNLSRGDRTGTWMLNYAFPYDSAPVQRRFASLARGLATSAAFRQRDDRATSSRDIIEAREQLRASLAPDDYRYLAFQMWQEGVARYTELQVARLAAAEYAPTASFRALSDFTPFAVEADSLERGIRAGLGVSELGRSKRVAFYSAGAATALLLDATVPDWKRSYFARGFSLDAQFP